MINGQSLFDNYYLNLKSAIQSFRQISEYPSDENVAKLKYQAQSIKAIFCEMVKWYEDRAKSWPDFMDSYQLYRTTLEGRKEGVFRRYGPRAFSRGLMAIILNVLSGGTLSRSIAYTITFDLSLQALKKIINFRWQTRSLLSASKKCKQQVQEIDKFLQLFNFPIRIS